MICYYLMIALATKTTTKIKEIIYTNGFYFVLEDRGCQNNKVFLHLFTERLIDQFTQQ